ncbi:hypothetical protein GCM10025868_47130 [Angustibacter aerolatus]|nr:hypothetical protein [Angustibacter aerolatus]GMA89463.1 hypothetical protein GCM10025868_47130 [Angustibacter aerolatus]
MSVTNATWATQPTVDTSATYSSSATFSHGYEPGCSNDYGTLDVKKIVAGWASGALTNYGIEPARVGD